MDQNRLKRICEKALESRGVLISEFRALPTHQYDSEKGEWVPDSYSLFLGLKRNVSDNMDESNQITYRGRTPESANLEDFLQSLLGFECVVDFD